MNAVDLKVKFVLDRLASSQVMKMFARRAVRQEYTGLDRVATICFVNTFGNWGAFLALGALNMSTGLFCFSHSLDGSLPPA